MSGKKRIAVLTSGGDAPGMNAAIRGVVRTAIHLGGEAVGIQRGYSGLLNEEMRELSVYDVSDIIQRGGTMLATSRCKEFMHDEGIEKAAEILKKHEIDGLVVIGGNGSYKGAQKLAHKGVSVVCIPGTIDLDISSTDYTIGFDTAVNTAMEAIDRIRDTSKSHDRCSVIEVMGRAAGFIALYSGIAGGVEEILLPENKEAYSEEKLIEHIKKSRECGRRHFIIVNSEGIGHSTSMARRIEEATGIETRATILGYMQRGGSPTCRDRVTASRMGAKAAELLLKGTASVVISELRGEIVALEIDDALAMNKTIPGNIYETAKRLTVS